MLEVSKRKCKRKHRAAKTVKRRYEKSIVPSLQAREEKLLLDEECTVVSAAVNAENELYTASDTLETLEEIMMMTKRHLTYDK